MTVELELAAPSAMPAVRALLASAALPVADLESVAIRFLVARDGRSLAGAIGLERYGDTGLLRSLVVAASHQRRGIGRTLVAEVERDAKAAGVTLLVLLTETAEPFFAKHGYRVTDRKSVRGGVQGSAEFRSLCPASATCMTKSLV